MSDMAAAIVPKSDQLNSDDLIAGPITIKITSVSIKIGEQPIAISYEGDKGKPYKCCKSMARVMVTAWGPDSKAYTGRSMTLYRDPSVKWAGMEVGGIRISHMTDIDSPLTMALTATKGSRKPYTVKPLVIESVPVITAEEVQSLTDRCSEHGIDVAKLAKAAGADLAAIKAKDLPRAHAWIDKQVAQKTAKDVL